MIGIGKIDRKSVKIQTYRKIDQTVLMYDILQIMSKQYGSANEEVQ